MTDGFLRSSYGEVAPWRTPAVTLERRTHMNASELYNTQNKLRLREGACLLKVFALFCLLGRM